MERETERGKAGGKGQENTAKERWGLCGLWRGDEKTNGLSVGLHGGVSDLECILNHIPLEVLL